MSPALLAAPFVLALAALLLRRHFPRAVLAVAPSKVRIEPDAPADQMKPPRELAPIVEELLALGFVPLASHYERPPIGDATVVYDYVHAQGAVFASVFLHRSTRGLLGLGLDERAAVYFLTPAENGGFVITANYVRHAREVPGRYLCAGLEGFPLDRLYRAHLRRLDSQQMVPLSALDAQGRIAVAQEWLAGPGRNEIRKRNLDGLLWTVGSLGMVAALVAEVLQEAVL